MSSVNKNYLFFEPKVVAAGQDFSVAKFTDQIQNFLNLSIHEIRIAKINMGSGLNEQTLHLVHGGTARPTQKEMEKAVKSFRRKYRFQVIEVVYRPLEKALTELVESHHAPAR